MDPIALNLPLPATAASSAALAAVEEAITPSEASNNNPYHQLQQPPPPPTSSGQQLAPSLDSPGFRDKVLALFNTVSCYILKGFRQF